MKLQCDRAKLASAFQLACFVATTRSHTKPILTNVRLDADRSGSGRLTATDLEVGIVVPVENLEVSEPGTVLLPSRLFGSIIRESTDEKLSLSVDKQGLKVSGERSNFKLSAASPEDFPAVPGPDLNRHHRISAGTFRACLQRTSFAADCESSRYALGGVLIELDRDVCIAVATDGRRLAKMQGTAIAVDGHKTDIQTIVPLRTVSVLEKLLVDPDAEIQIACSQNGISVVGPAATLVSRLVEGRFPRWRDVIPVRSGATVLDLSVAAVTAAIRQAAITTNEESRSLKFDFSAGLLRLATETAEIGSSSVEVPIGYQGPGLTTTLDYRYVLDFLRNCGAETCRLELDGSESAALFSTLDGYQCVVMPLAST